MTVSLEEVAKTRYKVYLDGEFAFVLYKGELSRYHIREGAELTQETYQEILEQVIFKRARKKAMHLLEDMDRTEAGLREKLRLGLYPEEAVENALAYVKSFGYVDDDRYVQNFIRSRIESMSRKELYAKLRGKGIDSEKIGFAMEEAYEETGEQVTIERIIRKRRVDPGTANEREMQKLYGYLARKGFRYEDVRQVIQNYNQNA